MQLINNKRIKAGEFLSEHITGNAHLSVISSLFSIYAFEMLEAKLPFIQKLRLLFSAPIDFKDNLALIGGSDERKLRNRLTQQFVAQKCKDWLAANSEIRQATAQNIVQQNLFCTENAALQGSADLTASGLGFVDDSQQRTRCEGCLNAEIQMVLQKVVYLLQHVTAGGNRSLRRIERREALRKFIGIHELVALQHFREECVGSGCLSGAVASGDDIHVRH